jgi:hypothetical protein
MAAPITLSVTAGASAETIFEGLTTEGGLAVFWASDSRAEPVVGSFARFSFPSGSQLELRVDRLDSRRRVVWSPLTDPPAGSHWIETTVIWELRPTERDATGAFLQHGRLPDDPSQLEGYAEAGTPRPCLAKIGSWPAAW